MRDIIINSIDKYYNNGLVDDIKDPVQINIKKKSMHVLIYNNESAGDISFERGYQPLSIPQSAYTIVKTILANVTLPHSGSVLLQAFSGIFIIMNGPIIITPSTLPLQPYVL